MPTSIAPLSLHPTPSPIEPYILVVDDDPASLNGLKSVIEAAGHACVATTSPADALALSATRPPALVVTDLAMPRLDGQGLARGMRARHPWLPILLVTGEMLDSSARSTLGHTFAAVLTKPIEVERLLGVLHGLMPPPLDTPRR